MFRGLCQFSSACCVTAGLKWWTGSFRWWGHHQLGRMQMDQHPKSHQRRTLKSLHSCGSSSSRCTSATATNVDTATRHCSLFKLGSALEPLQVDTSFAGLPTWRQGACLVALTQAVVQIGSASLSIYQEVNHLHCRLFRPTLSTPMIRAAGPTTLCLLLLSSRHVCV